MSLDAFGRVIGIRPVTEPFKVDFKTYWMCHFPGVRYLGPYSSLVTVAGRGASGRKARADFVNRIRGRTAVVGADAGSPVPYREFPVPGTLTA